MSDVMQADLLRIGGAGNFRIPARSITGVNPVAGEEAGCQDFLWGRLWRSGAFRMRSWI